MARCIATSTRSRRPAFSSPADSKIKDPSDLAGVPVSVGYQSGSHYSTVQALEQYLKPEQINLVYSDGMLFARMEKLFEGKAPAVHLFGGPYYFAEQLGFRKVIDCTFMIGTMIHGDPDPEDLRKFFRALRKAQRAKGCMMGTWHSAENLFHALNLTDDQKAQVREAFGTYRAAVQPLWKEMQTTRQQLQDVLLNPNGLDNAAPLQTAQQHLTGLQADLLQARITLAQTLRGVLTPTQLTTQNRHPVP